MKLLECGVKSPNVQKIEQNALRPFKLLNKVFKSIALSQRISISKVGWKTWR